MTTKNLADPVARIELLDDQEGRKYLQATIDSSYTGLVPGFIYDPETESVLASEGYCYQVEPGSANWYWKPK